MSCVCVHMCGDQKSVSSVFLYCFPSYRFYCVCMYCYMCMCLCVVCACVYVSYMHMCVPVVCACMCASACTKVQKKMLGVPLYLPCLFLRQDISH